MSCHIFFADTGHKLKLSGISLVFTRYNKSTVFLWEGFQTSLRIFKSSFLSFLSICVVLVDLNLHLGTMFSCSK